LEAGQEIDPVPAIAEPYTQRTATHPAGSHPLVVDLDWHEGLWEVEHVLDVIQIKPRHKAHPNAASIGVLRDLRVPLALDALREVRERMRVADLLHAEDVGSNVGDHPRERRQLGLIGLIVFGTAGVPGRKRFSRFHVAMISPPPPTAPALFPPRPGARWRPRSSRRYRSRPGRCAFTSRAEKIGSSLVARRGSAEATAPLDHSVCAGLF